MKKTLAIVAVALFVGTPLFAENLATITYTLQMGGKNAVDQGWTGDPGTPLAFDASTAVEAGSVYVGASDQDIFTWSVRVDVLGSYSPDPGPAPGEPNGNETPVNGAANLVWDLAVKDSAGNLVALGHGSPTAKGFFSTVQDGVKTYAGSTLTEENAAFPWSVDPYGTGPARIWDSGLNGGLGMLQYTYPNTAGYKAGSTASEGMLMGMGAGYKDFAVVTNPGTETSVVGGLGAAEGDCVLPSPPIAEGQINMKDLPNGTYTLQLIPGKGNNVVWFPSNAIGNCIVGDPGAFAVAVPQNKITAPELQFVKNSIVIVPPPVLTAAASRKLHGTTAWDLPVSMATTGNATVEPRRMGTDVVRLVALYNKDIATLPTVVASAGTATVTLEGTKTAVIAISGVPDKTCLSVTVNGAVGTDGGIQTEAQVLKLSLLQGDVNGSRTVNGTDVNLIKSKLNQAVTADNCKYDINCSNSINGTDVNICKSKLNNTLTCTLP